jgi:hypothetical protein
MRQVAGGVSDMPIEGGNSRWGNIRPLDSTSQSNDAGYISRLLSQVQADVLSTRIFSGRLERDPLMLLVPVVLVGG